MTFLLQREDLISPDAGSMKKAYVLLHVCFGIVFFQKRKSLCSDACKSEKANLADCLEEKSKNI